MSRRRPVGASLLLAASLACGGAVEQEAEGPRLSLVGTLAGADTVGFARAIEPRSFVFPDDHGPHPEYRNEWWYVTGNLDADDGRHFGFQLTIFRTSLTPTAPSLASDWATNQAFMGHFTLTDVDGGRFHAFERFGRGALGLAGAEVSPLRVWIDGWSMEGTGLLPLRLRAADGPVAIDLVLSEGKPRVLQGVDGLSRKGPEAGNASYYYAYTRMPARGTVSVEGSPIEVSGNAWLDREWSTSALSAGLVGWDWFALQLDDGWELMVYALRRGDGSASAESAGALIDPEGRRSPLAWGDDVTVAVTERWRSPIDGAEYPARWRVRLPDRGWDLDVRPLVRDQELDLAFRYWEGAVAVTGDGEGGVGVDGLGYVELTGYAGVGATDPPS